LEWPNVEESLVSWLFLSIDVTFQTKSDVTNVRNF
jgi:hypothetical protein